MQEIKTAVVIPCYNEEKRLRRDQIQALLQPGIQLILVNDGSSDQTLSIIQQLRMKHPDYIHVIDLEKNGGKAEAVRAGLNYSIQNSFEWLGYVDADFATPADEILRLVKKTQTTSHNVIMASRILLLGSNIERKKTRHYLGRIFATFVSLGLNLRVYDTQCGAKFFRKTEILRRSLNQAFHTRWVFDVELIGRLLQNGMTKKDFLEVPLNTWADIDGSKLTPTSMFRAGWDLLCLIVRFRLNKKSLNSVSLPQE